MIRRACRWLRQHERVEGLEDRCAQLTRALDDGSNTVQVTGQDRMLAHERKRLRVQREHCEQRARRAEELRESVLNGSYALQARQDADRAENQAARAGAVAERMSERFMELEESVAVLEGSPVRRVAGRAVEYCDEE